MTEFDMIAFLWDQVKALSEKARQHDSQVQLGFSAMCKLENKGIIKHLIKEAHEAVGVEAPAPIEEETIPEPPPKDEPEPVVEEVVPDVVEEVIEEVVKDVVPEIVDPEPKPIEADNIDDLLEQYKTKLQE